MRPARTSERVDAHVDAFNHAVRTSDWEGFAARFAPDARMDFVGVPIGPFEGRDEIAGAYRANPPDDAMAVLDAEADGAVDVVRFGWNRAGTGTMRLRWTSEGLVAALSVAFD
jgi:steroid Delta-isomerase